MKTKIVAVLLLIGVVFLSACSDDDSTKLSKEEKASLPSYEIVRKDDNSIGEIVRMDYWVVPHKEELSEEEFKNIAKEVVETGKKDKKFNALMIYFIEDENGIGKDLPLARGEYSPEGDWGKAMDVKAGEYKNYELAIKDYMKPSN